MSLRDDILNNPACAAAIEAKDCHEIARIVSEGRTRLQSRYIGQGTVLDVMNNGGEFLDLLVAIGEQVRSVYWAIDLLRSGRFDIGTAKAQSQLDTIAAAHPEFNDDIQAIKKLGYVEASVTAFEVGEAIFNDDGSLK